MWWDAAQTIGSTVRWFFVDESDFLPFPHAYSSEIWDPVHWINPGIGEAWNLNQDYTNGHLPDPVPSDANYCGPPDWWLNGCPSDAPPLEWVDGLPECCTPATGEYTFEYTTEYDRCRNTEECVPCESGEGG